MANFLDWHDLNETQIIHLERTIVADEVKSLLESYMKIPFQVGPKREIAIDFHFHNYAFCKERAFDARRIAAFMSIMNCLFIRDTNSTSPLNNAEESFSYFRDLILRHSVQRPPRSIQIFSRDDVDPIIDYALESYFRQFLVYKYIFTPKTRLVFRQVLPNSVETPRPPPLLSAGFKISAPADTLVVEAARQEPQLLRQASGHGSSDKKKH